MSSIPVLLERLGTFALTWSWQMAVLVGFAWIVVRLDRRHRPALRHQLWVATLLFGVLLPWMPRWIAAQSFTRNVRQALAPPVEVSPAQVPAEILVIPVGKALPPAVTVPQPAASAPSGWSVSRATLLQAAGLFWMVGFAAAAFRGLGQYRRLGRLASSAAEGEVSVTPPVRFSPDVRTPMLFGWYRPIILLPADVATWSTPEERATMIRHERTHYLRRDHWVAAFEALIRAVFFFHPFARWVCRQIDIERELACDEEVLRQGADPETYAEAIIKVAEQAVRGGVPCGVHFSGHSQLDRRVDLLFRAPRPVARPILIVLPLLLLLIPTGVLGVWQAPFEILTPLVFRIEVNPLRLLPEEVFAPTARPTAIVASRPQAPAPAVNPPGVATTTGGDQLRDFVSESADSVNRRQGNVPQSVDAPDLDIALLRVTEEQVMVSLTAGVPHSLLTFSDDPQGRDRKATVRIEGVVTNLTGKIIQRMEDSLEVKVPAAGLTSSSVAVYQKVIYLRPGLYRLFLIINSNGANSGTIDTRLEVPRFAADKLNVSSLTVADLIESLPLREPAAQFRIGNLRVRPAMYAFNRSQDLNIFQLIYPAERESRSVLPLYMETLITRDGMEIARVSEELARAAQVTVTRKLSLSDFAPGAYEIQITYTDAATGERVVSTGDFRVK